MALPSEEVDVSINGRERISPDGYDTHHKKRIQHASRFLS